MDRYLCVRKPTLADKKAAPYPPRTKLDEDRQRWSKLSARLSVDGKKPAPSTITRHLLNTLSDSSNPITHSNIYERSDTVVSATTGHQRGEGKLSFQRRLGDEFPKGVLDNVRVYIDGYLSDTTDIEMRRIIAQAGGTTLLVPDGATHIVTSQQLSGSKTHRFLTTRTRNPVHVVKPEWVTDSITAGRRLQESRYALVRSSSTRDLVDMLKSGGSS